MADRKRRIDQDRSSEVTGSAGSHVPADNGAPPADTPPVDGGLATDHACNSPTGQNEVCAAATRDKGTALESDGASGGKDTPIPASSGAPTAPSPAVGSGVEAAPTEQLVEAFRASLARYRKGEESIDGAAAARRSIIGGILNGTGTGDVDIGDAIAESNRPLEGYATLDDQHRMEIEQLIGSIGAYLSDPTRRRPLNVLMLAAPGAGKSHFIKCLAKHMKDQRVRAVTFNMASMQDNNELAQPIDEVRNLKVNDAFPLLFLDEFDSDERRYAALLPLLWDGELHVAHRDLKLGKVVIVLAGSRPSLPKTMKRSGSLLVNDGEGEALSHGAQGKLVDLLSRINGGVIEIPSLEARGGGRDRRADKVCVGVGVLRARFGEQLEYVPRSLLKFIALTKFRHGVRSISHLVEMIAPAAVQEASPGFTSTVVSIVSRKGKPKKMMLNGDLLALPFGTPDELRRSSLAQHIMDEDGALGITKRWGECCAVDARVQLNPDPYRFLKDIAGYAKEYVPIGLGIMNMVLSK